jgi:hypothetical protein
MEKKYICEKCEVGFNHQSSYCRHKKKCQPNENQKPSKSELENKLIQSEMENKLMQMENKLLKYEMQTPDKKTHKKMKECDITFKEFTDSIELSFENIDTIINLGYIQGMTNIIINKLDELDDKPIYCTDTRRMIIYLMEESWIKNEQELFKFIIQMRGKVYDIFNRWLIENPNHIKDGSIENEKKLSYSITMFESSNENHHKIIRNIAKYVQI